MLEILSRYDITCRLKESKENAVLISEPIVYPEDKNEVLDLFSLCKNYINLEFFDSIHPNLTGSPRLKDIKNVLDWAKDKQDELILVSCLMGVSRSSAVAYLIECQRVGPQEAVKILDPTKHQPNILILKLGAQLLGEECYTVANDYLATVKEDSWD